MLFENQKVPFSPLESRACERRLLTIVDPRISRRVKRESFGVH